jgi:hypothetical protein
MLVETILVSNGRRHYPFLWAFLLWLCWEEFFDSVKDVSDRLCVGVETRRQVGHTGHGEDFGTVKTVGIAGSEA